MIGSSSSRSNSVPRLDGGGAPRLRAEILRGPSWKRCLNGAPRPLKHQFSGEVLVTAALAALWLGLTFSLPSSAQVSGSMKARTEFAGAEACAGCHAPEAERWKNSHHAKAMQKATPTNVLGDFASATLTHHGLTTTFSRDGEKFVVRTEGPDGALHDYEIAYTFGVYPLQQYLIAFPGGRYQALGIAWDSRPKDHGGQRWFPLYPGQTLRAGDSLHWTGRDQTWNYQCATCHSTDLKKNYDLATDSYATQLDQYRRRLRGLPRPGLPPYCLGRGARGRKFQTIAGGTQSSAGNQPDRGSPRNLSEPAPTNGR